MNILNFPKSTCLNKFVAKNKFYEKADISNSLKTHFVNDIENIYWINKISSATLNIEAGDILEIEVFHIKLKVKNFNQKILEIIDRTLPYYILYLLEYNNLYQLYIGYKEKILNSKYKTDVKKYFFTQWNKEIPKLEIQGSKIDTIYQNFITQISNNQIVVSQNSNLKIEIEKDIIKSKIDKEILILQKKINNEKQLNIKIKYDNAIKKLLKQKEEL